MKKNVLLSLLPLTLLLSCGGSAGDQRFVGFKEDLGEGEILKDNYRNFYQIFVYSYADSDGDKIGDLKGITSKIPYLSSLGYTGIYLTPIFSANSYHKYDTVNYFEIDKDFGTMEDFEDLVKKAHENNIKVILDGVFNHCSLSSPYYIQAVEEHQKKIAGQTYDEKKENLIRFFDSEEEARRSGCTYYKAGGNNFYYEGNFDRQMPEFNFESEATYDFFDTIFDFYAKKGVDGFRFDAAKYFFYGETQKSIEAASRLAESIKAKIDDAYVIGEVWSGSTEIAEYYKSELDSYFYFPAAGTNGFLLSSSATDGMFKLNYYDGQKAMIANAKDHIPAPFLDNHDMARVSAGKHQARTMFRLGLRGMLTGATFNYYGDEIGMNSSNLPSGDYVDASYRTHYLWDDETHEMETKDAPNARAQTSNYPDSKTQLKDPYSILNYEKKVNELRNRIPAIARGKMIDLEESDKLINEGYSPLLIVRKEWNNQKIKIVYNFSSLESSEYDISSCKVKSALLSSEDPIRLNKKTLLMPPLSIAVLAE